MENNNNGFRLAILPLLILSFLAAELHGATYYVSASGSDSNIGTSDAPFRTIQKAANTASAGDIVTVNAGTYNEVVTISQFRELRLLDRLSPPAAP